MKTMQLPQVDMLRVTKNARKVRSVLPSFLPEIGLAVFDYPRMGEIDALYELCQQQREFYKDPKDKVRRVEFFDIVPKKYATRPDPNSVYLRIPWKYPVENQPVIYPLNPTDARNKKLPEAINLSGKYNYKPCFIYKR